MWAPVRCFLKTFPYSCFYRKGRACRKTSYWENNMELYETVGTQPQTTHILCCSFRDDVCIPRNCFSWNASLFPPQNYPSSVQAIVLFCPQWIKELHISFQNVHLAEMGHFFIWTPGTWFCQLYSVHKKPLLSTFTVSWGSNTNNFKLRKCCWEYCFIWEF